MTSKETWISVKDRLPKRYYGEFSFPLVFRTENVKNGIFLRLGYFDITLNEFVESGAETRFTCQDVTHYYTLPELPMEEIVIEEPKYKNPVCRGCIEFGNACGHCERCKWRASQKDTH